MLVNWVAYFGVNVRSAGEPSLAATATAAASPAITTPIPTPSHSERRGFLNRIMNPLLGRRNPITCGVTLQREARLVPAHRRRRPPCRVHLSPDGARAQGA